MSYSFTAKGDTKDAALADAAQKFDAMVQQQPVHSRDREAALANAHAHLQLVAEPGADEEITLSMYGSISVQMAGTATPERVTHAGSNSSVSVGRRVVVSV